MELGSVHVAGVGELFLRPSIGGDDGEMLVMITMVVMMLMMVILMILMMMVVVKEEPFFSPSWNRPHPRGSVSHCSGKLPLTVPDVCFDFKSMTHKMVVCKVESKRIFD